MKLLRILTVAFQVRLSIAVIVDHSVDVEITLELSKFLLNHLQWLVVVLIEQGKMGKETMCK